jgi:hypothetical protein
MASIVQFPGRVKRNIRVETSVSCLRNVCIENCGMNERRLLREYRIEGWADYLAFYDDV